MAIITVVMMAAMNLPLSVTTALGQALPCAGTAAGVFLLHIFVMDMLLVGTALTSQIPGRIARIAQRRATCPAQVFLATVQSFATEGQLVQMLGMNYFLRASPNQIWSHLASLIV